MGSFPLDVVLSGTLFSTNINDSDQNVMWFLHSSSGTVSQQAQGYKSERILLNPGETVEVILVNDQRQWVDNGWTMPAWTVHIYVPQLMG